MKTGNSFNFTVLIPWNTLYKDAFNYLGDGVRHSHFHQNVHHSVAGFPVGFLTIPIRLCYKF